MAFWDMYYHIVWATHGRSHFITPKLEETLFGLVKHKSQMLNCPIHAINSMPNHIHVVVSINPSLAVMQWGKHIKGFSSYQINQLDILEDHFRWQSGYGSITYGRKALPNILEYVQKQKQRHANDDVYQYLERIDTNEIELL